MFFILISLLSAPGLSYSSLTTLFTYAMLLLLTKVSFNILRDKIAATYLEKDVFEQALNDEHANVLVVLRNRKENVLHYQKDVFFTAQWHFFLIVMLQ